MRLSTRPNRLNILIVEKPQGGQIVELDRDDTRRPKMLMSVTRAAAIVVLSVTLAASTVTLASAKGPGGGGGPPHGFSQGQKSGWNGTVPPGWSKGKKTGWGSSRAAPPGWR